MQLKISCLIGFVLSCFYKSNFSRSLLWLERPGSPRARTVQPLFPLSLDLEPRGGSSGNWALDVGSWKWEVGTWKSKVGNRKSEVGRPSSAFVCYRFCCMEQKYTRLKVKQCRLNVQRFDFVLLTNTVHRKKNCERWFLSLFLFLDRGCKCMGTSVCWSIHMFEYSANDFTTSSRSFCFSSKRFSVFRRNDHKRRAVETRC